MPTYLYQVIKADGSEGEVFECTHSMLDTLKSHPTTSEAVRRVYSVPHLGVKHTAGNTQKLLSNKNLEQKGFTKYERDKMSGKYHKVVGDGPSEIKRPSA